MMVVMMVMVVVLGANEAAAVKELTADGLSQEVPGPWQAGRLLWPLDHLWGADV